MDNDIWAELDSFLRERLKYMPDRFIYPDLKKYHPDSREKIIHEVIDMMCSNEKTNMTLNLLAEWTRLNIDDENK